MENIKSFIAVVAVAFAAVVFAVPGHGLAADESAGERSLEGAPENVLHPRVPFYGQWSKSAHANWKSEAKVHWNKEGEIPEDCAKCHTPSGFDDFLGNDGSAKGKVDAKAPIGGVIDCATCHNRAASHMEDVTFPSGFVTSGNGKSTICMQCHQGRASMADVDKATAGIGDDTPSKDIKFANIHYKFAAATGFGKLAAGGYAYPGKDYAGRYQHKPEADQCIECHSPHSLKVQVEKCLTCHKEANKESGFAAMRTAKTDFDGDGDTTKGIKAEVEQLRELLYRAIQDYAKSTAGAAIVYDVHAYPYFFYDTNSNGTPDKDEAVFKNQYKSWTPRLLRAAYNYQFATKDKGAYVHNPNYVIQLLYDSIMDVTQGKARWAKKLARPQ